ncbi:MAG: peptidase T [Acidimicrobiia bacterium]|nr:peptidase T [Acidimicrobiia bacterium]
MPEVLERFLRYVRVDTRSDESSPGSPSSPGQLVLLEMLASELRAMGAADVSRDQYGYVMATVPATSGCENVPAIGFVAHVDTSPEMSGTDVKPIVHHAWAGGDIVLPDHPDAVLRPSEDRDLAAQAGHDIITASGLTLLGADDKAGVAAIMGAVEHLLRHPDVPHGAVRVGFTPDEEIGRGAVHFDVERFGAVCAYTVDGGACGELEIESFSADLATITFQGVNTHPGYAKGTMVNAIRVAAAFIDLLPRDQSPEATDGRDGFLHPYVVDASVDRTSVRVLLRDFDTAALRVKAALLEDLARQAVSRHPGARMTLHVQEQYRNMREVLERTPHVVERAAEAIRCAGFTVTITPIRGGTDGSRLSFMGLPTPNLFSGVHNIHSRLEWTSRQDLEAASRVVVELARIWAESPHRGARRPARTALL